MLMRKVFIFAVLLVPQFSLAHEIPTNIVVQVMLKAEGDEMQMLVRVPMEAMRDVIFPEFDRGYLLVSQADETLQDAATIWIAQEFDFYEDGNLINDWSIEHVRASLPSNRSFSSWDRAVAHMQAAPLADDERILTNQALLDVQISYPIASADSRFAVEPRFTRLGLQTTTVIRYLQPDDSERLYTLMSDPGLLYLDPGWWNAFSQFVVFGFEHILEGIDHLLFILCLIIPFRRIRPLIAIVTAFTVAHSVTLVASVLGIAPNVMWFAPLIETLIAASIVYMAIENTLGANWQTRWLVTFMFGLVHGFGFSFAVSEMLQFAGGHMVTSLLAFNLGVELGQLLVVIIMVPVLNWLIGRTGERAGIIILSVLVAHTAWHWMAERFSAFMAFPLQLSDLGQIFSAGLIRWLMLALVVGTLLWVMNRLFGRYLSGHPTLTNRS